MIEMEVLKAHPAGGKRWKPGDTYFLSANDAKIMARLGNAKPKEAGYARRDMVAAAVVPVVVPVAAKRAYRRRNLTAAE